MTSTSRVGHCQKCNFQWVLLPGQKVSPGGRDATKPPATVCPFCGSDKIRIEHEKE